jgi:hypothetical protein
MQILGVLASARRKAYELDRTVVGVGRMGSPVHAETTAIDEPES